jgi:hypothetical protein
MKQVVLALALLTLAACMPYQSMTTRDPNWIREGGEAPEGYPRSFVENVSGTCSVVTETWEAVKFGVHPYWIKHQAREPVACP